MPHLSATLIIGIVVAISVPIAFLAFIRWLDLYASGNFKGIVLCFGWGIIAFFGALYVNSYLLFPILGYVLVLTTFAPIVEEIFKSLALVYYVRRPDFTYFVDGAIYGFCTGTGFAVTENIMYLLLYGGGDQQLTLAVARVFSAALMHGSASGLVGVALGRLRFGRGFSRLLSILVGWGFAMALHISYNTLMNQDTGLMTLVMAFLIGLGGVGLMAILIFWGLREERKWLQETVDLGIGVSSGESAVIQEMDNLDVLLSPIAKRFGEDKRKKVEQFLYLEAKIGLKKKVQSLTADDMMRGELGMQIVDMYEEMEKLRREVGVYCMSYVRSILPPGTVPMLQTLEQRIIDQSTLEKKSNKPSMWSTLNHKVAEHESSDKSTP